MLGRCVVSAANTDVLDKLLPPTASFVSNSKIRCSYTVKVKTTKSSAMLHRVDYNLLTNVSEDRVVSLFGVPEYNNRTV